MQGLLKGCTGSLTGGQIKPAFYAWVAVPPHHKEGGLGDICGTEQRHHGGAPWTSQQPCLGNAHPHLGVRRVIICLFKSSSATGFE